MMIIALGTVSGLLQERFWDYYENGFGIITGTVLGLLLEQFWDYYWNGFRLLRERFQIIMGTLLGRFEDVWERFVVTMHRYRYRYYGTVLILIERF